MRILTLTILAILLSTPLLCGQKQYPDTEFVLVNAQIVDLDRQSVIPGHVVVRNGLVDAIITDGRQIPEGLDQIDLEGNYLFPGMIDVHTHLQSLAAANLALHSGVTTVRSAGVSAFQDVSIANLTERGHLPGPDVIAAGVYVTPHLGETILADTRLHRLQGPVDDETELRHLVRINIDRGAKVIKTRGTERAGRPETDPRQQTYTTQQLSWVIDEAAKSNIPVMIHAHGDEGARAAVMAGAKSIEHGTFLSRETLELMKEREVYLVPTYITLLDLTQPGGDYDDPVLLMRGNYMVPKSQEVIRTAIEIGVTLATGADNRYTDQSTSRVSMEVEAFIELGMDPWEALKTTTSNAADLLGLGQRTGRIERGYEADFIVIGDHPAEHAKALQDVLMVISNGHMVFNRLPFGLD